VDDAVQEEGQQDDAEVNLMPIAQSLNLTRRQSLSAV
jgi:hypothetical protein